MFHTVIIPVRDYERYLPHCCWALWRSATLCRQEKELEICLVREAGDSHCATPPCGDVVQVDRQGRYFNKCRLQNIGIQESHGDVLTFLDADSIVGPRFLETGPLLLQPEYARVTKFCYRVRYLPPAALQQLNACTGDQDKEALVGLWFNKWLYFDRAFEGYGQAETNVPDNRVDPQAPVFGNSDFSIRRDVLGDLRFDEQYVGRGYEDVEMNRRIWRHYGQQYKALIMTDADHGVFQIRNPYQGEVWGPGEQNSRNQQRYAST